jgi:hypothetical protein
VNPFSRSRPTLPAAAPASAPPQGFSSLPDQSVRPACSRKARLPFTPVGSSLPADLLLNSRYRGSSFQTRYAPGATLSFPCWHWAPNWLPASRRYSPRQAESSAS